MLYSKNEMYMAILLVIAAFISTAVLAVDNHKLRVEIRRCVHAR